MYAIFFGPYLLIGLFMVFALFWWTVIADAREDKRGWSVFGMRSPEEYRAKFGDRPPY